MPLITQSISKDYLDAYDGYNQQAVGLGMLNPNIYATPSYQKKKVNNLAIGLISSIVYGGAEHDPTPDVLIIGYETAYNTVIGFSLRYATPKLRAAIMKFVLDSNAARIKGNQPIMIDYHSMKRAVPDCQYIVRRYKVVGISVRETYPLSEWPAIAKKTTPFDGFFMRFKDGRAR
jgi:hypothetical protein